MCEGNRVTAELLEESVLSELSVELFAPERVRRMLAALSQSTSSMAAEHHAKRLGLEAERRGIEQRLQHQYEAIEAGLVTSSDVGQRIRDLKARAEELGGQLGAIPEPSELPAIPIDDEAVELSLIHI